MDPHLALEQLLLRLFNADELRRFLRYLDHGRELVQDLPTGSTEHTTLVHAAVSALDRRGLVTEAFFQRLMIERPSRAHEIGAVMVAFAEAEDEEEEDEEEEEEEEDEDEEEQEDEDFEDEDEDEEEDEDEDEDEDFEDVDEDEDFEDDE